MSDRNAGRYGRIAQYQRDFDLAERILGAGLRWGEHDYEAFVYEANEVRLVFYPHRTTAGAYHTRVRDGGSRDKAKADLLMRKLDEAAPHCCTFTRKSRHIQ